MTLAERLHIPEKTVRDQRRAADPCASAWVSANAGAGKTKVLTDRVVRLLLAGAPPGRILCLTFTKTAAAKMAIEVFGRLGRWVTLDDAALVRELTELEGEPPTREQMSLARRLFARAVETPGGLKIETIHAFCERLLHMVPFEANVPARFAVLDEAQANELVAEATANVLADAAVGGDSTLRKALDTVSAEAAGEGLAAAIAAAVRDKTLLQHPGGLAGALDRLRSAFGLFPGDTPAAIDRAMIEEGFPPRDWPAIAQTLQTGKSWDEDRAASLRAAIAADDPALKLRHYLSVFFTGGGEGEPRSEKAIVTKSVDPALKENMLAEQSRLTGLSDRRKAVCAIERTGALFRLAGEINRRVVAAKARLGALDFDDLIEKTLALLRRGDGDWVLYKLDRGIDHVLVDEAQDTNPAQWEILKLITTDFTAGRGARGERIRTVFAVGDPKQSIYGFQGAAPREFEVSRRWWAERASAVDLTFEDVRLTLSFRSARALLSAVDATFQVAEHFRGLSFEATAIGTVHTSARPDAPGLVELWSVERPAEEPEPEAWTAPVDEPERRAPPVVVARRVAQAIKCWTAEGDEWGRVRRAGDILVLVRKRGPAFAAVIRALKEAGVPVAGADRLDIGEHIAVRDLAAAGRAALLPDDDLTLAAALKSPLVGLTDEDLIRIAAGRADHESLAAALERHADAANAAARMGRDALQSWRSLARRHGPFGFYATLLGPMSGRSRLVAQLGNEAGDAIDAFLCLAHGAERTETPSLATFLTRFESASHEVKRDLDTARDEVRVMTVHGAKGLEAPIVILIDGCEVHGPQPCLIPVDAAGAGTLPVWSPGKTYDCAALAAAREAVRTRAREEHNRLLYVAMTRARDRLVIAPYLTACKDSPEGAWCEMIRRGLVATARDLVLSEAPYGPVAVWHDGEHPVQAAPLAERAPTAPVELPTWLLRPAAPELEPLPPLRPSGVLDAADWMLRPPEPRFDPDARLRGALVHELLESLSGVPAERRAAIAQAYVATRATRLAREKQSRVVADALGVTAHETLGPLFGPDARAEAPIVGSIRIGPESVPVSGQIDRLAVLRHEVLIADFKTARPPHPDEPAPHAYVAQLALYRALLREIYPSHWVRAFLVWTAGPLVRELAEDELERALAQVKAA